jgi:hypothetical protein
MKKRILISISILFSSTSWSQVHSTTTVYQAPPEYFSAGTQFYNLNLAGFRKYVDRYNVKEMQEPLKKLEHEQTVAYATMWSLIGTGTLLTVGSFTFLKVDGEDFQGEKTKDPNAPVFYGGLAVFGAGLLIGRFLAPGRDDYLDFINEHNSNPKRVPLKVNLGWNSEHLQPTLLVKLDI